MTSKVVNGSLWSIGGQIGILFSSLLATSFVIRLLGTELYGVWSLLVLITGYATQSDLGMGTASTRFASQAFAELDEQKENTIIWTAFLIAMVPSLVISIGLAAFSKIIVGNFLKIPVQYQSQVVIGVILIALGFSFKIASNIFNTPQLVRLRMDINASIVSGLAIVQVLLTPAAIWIWGGVVPAAATLALFSLLTLVFLFLASQRLLSRLKRPSFDIALVKPLVGFGGILVLSGIVGVFLGTVEKPLLARYASITDVAHYAVASTLGNVMSIFPIAVSQPLMPAFTQLYTSGNIHALRNLYVRAIRGNMMWSLPMAYFLCVVAKPFFTVWAGEEFGREATVPLYIIVVGLLINVFSYIPYILLQASGRAKMILRIYVVEFVLYVFVATGLISLYGAKGAAAAWSLRILFDAIVFFIYIKPIIHNVTEPFLKISIWYWVSFLVFAVTGTLLINYVSYIPILILISASLMILYGFTIITKILKPEEKNWVFGRARALYAVFSKRIFR